LSTTAAILDYRIQNRFGHYAVESKTNLGINREVVGVDTVIILKIKRFCGCYDPLGSLLRGGSSWLDCFT
jgi:hypothetical protein